MATFDDSQRVFQYDKGELRKIALVIRKMGDEAKDQAREVTGTLVDFVVGEIKQAAGNHPRPKQARRIAEGIKISKSSVVGEFGIGIKSVLNMVNIQKCFFKYRFFICHFFLFKIFFY